VRKYSFAQHNAYLKVNPFTCTLFMPLAHCRQGILRLVAIFGCIGAVDSRRRMTVHMCLYLRSHMCANATKMKPRDYQILEKSNKFSEATIKNAVHVTLKNIVHVTIKNLDPRCYFSHCNTTYPRASPPLVTRPNWWPCSIMEQHTYGLGVQRRFH
jgi:hypothetical protein